MAPSVPAFAGRGVPTGFFEVVGTHGHMRPCLTSVLVPTHIIRRVGLKRKDAKARRTQRFTRSFVRHAWSHGSKAASPLATARSATTLQKHTVGYRTHTLKRGLQTVHVDV